MMTQGNGRKPGQEAPEEETPPLEKRDNEDAAEESDVGEGEEPVTPKPGAED